MDTISTALVVIVLGLIFLNFRWKKKEPSALEKEKPLLEERPRGTSDFLFVETLMRNTIVRHENNIPLSDYTIRRVYKINNAEQKMRVERKKSLLRITLWNTDERILFHGSPNAMEIARKGFNMNECKNNNMFGKGIYLSSLSSKANQYAWGNNKGCPTHNDKACYMCTRTMLICRCIMGKELRTVTPRRTLPPGYHSVVATPTCKDSIDCLKYPEFVLSDSDQAEPMFHVEYTINYFQQYEETVQGNATELQKGKPNNKSQKCSIS